MKAYYADIRVWFSVPDKHHDYKAMDAANDFARDVQSSSLIGTTVFSVTAICNSIERCPVDDTAPDERS